MKAKRVAPTLSSTLAKYLNPRVGPKMAAGLSFEEAWQDVVKDIVVASLSSKPLNIFAAAINRLAELDDAGRLQIIDRCLTVCPVPESPPPGKAVQIQDLLMGMLTPESVPESEGATSFEIDAEFMNITKAVFEHSHKD
ncbi:3196_t:CDS:1 [Paraglomus occultum]|uniref:3196_t:CDS:1 n=1 Tax=Paraglomus occultum TaxID=144539 RepID=A0A9N8ZTT9_9GLOM|nr:3196_t:CDS:1 [Paraglomus occultum]